MLCPTLGPEPWRGFGLELGFGPRFDLGRGSGVGRGFRFDLGIEFGLGPVQCACVRMAYVSGRPACANA